LYKLQAAGLRLFDLIARADPSRINRVPSERPSTVYQRTGNGG